MRAAFSSSTRRTPSAVDQTTSDRRRLPDRRVRHRTRVRPARLSAMDAGFLQIESSTAPMHLGWAAVFAPPDTRSRPRFEQLRAHVEQRLDRAPRYRQRLIDTPPGAGEPVWIDDERFDIARHVRRASTNDLGALVDSVMSSPLDRDSPLWELWIADTLDDGSIGVVGKAHHCLVDGLAAVELMALLLDATPDPEPVDAEQASWTPASHPTRTRLLLDGVLDRAQRLVVTTTRLRRWMCDSEHIRAIPRLLQTCARTVRHAAWPVAPASHVNVPLMPQRHLAWTSRPMEDLQVIKRRFDTTINDVVLAVGAGALRRLMLTRNEAPIDLKAMVPISVRRPGDEWGNRLAFVFPQLPCSQPDAVRRLRAVQAAMASRKDGDEPHGADVILSAMAHAPQPVRRLGAKLLTSPRLFNLIISNIPGPSAPLYLLGCRAIRAYPIVPLDDGHGISIGITSVDGQACFGVYAQASLADDADHLATAINDSIGELHDAATRLLASQNGSHLGARHAGIASV
jgi:diacylglycerol O-acyltransferase